MDTQPIVDAVNRVLWLGILFLGSFCIVSILLVAILKDIQNALEKRNKEPK
jgi:hypothetical protein